MAAQKLPVLQLEAAKGKPFQAVLKAVETAGYTPRTIREEDFLFNVTPKTYRYVLVPLGNHIGAESLAMLSRYVADGGKLVLIPPEGMPDASVNRLFQMVGLPLSGVGHAPTDLNFHWKGVALPGAEALPAQSSMLMVSPAAPVEVLATWGSDYPAIVSTAKGALLNWQWGRQLSATTNLVALSKVMPLARPESFISSAPNPAPGRETAATRQLDTSRFSNAEQEVAQEFQPSREQLSYQSPIALSKAPTEEAQSVTVTQTDAAEHKVNDVMVSPSAETAFPAVKAKSRAMSSPAPSQMSKETVEGPMLQGVEAYRFPMLQALETILVQLAKADPPVMPAKPVKKAQPTPALQKPPATVAGAKAPGAKPAVAKSSQPQPKADPKLSETDDEVLNNILGTPGSETPAKPAATEPVNKTNPDALKPDDPLLKDKMDAGVQAEGPQAAPQEEKKQKHFSFLDAEAADVLAPEFDYGLYSMSLRILDDYRFRIQNAREAAKQLSMDLPNDKIDTLLREANTHKKKFESSYLGGKTQDGLNEFAQARRLTLQAMALTTESPKVEGRAIWLDRSTIIEARGPVELRKRIQKLQQAGINIIYFETINAGFPIYPSAIMKPNPMVQGWDPLQVAVEEGHRLGMEVHAWVWVFAVGNRRHNPLINMPSDYAGPVLTEGGMMNEALRNRDGGLMVDGRQNEFWLSPASPKARQFLLDSYKEIVTKYDVDGVQLDYIRYPFQTSGTRMGYEAIGREQFRHSTGVSLDNLDDYVSRLWIAWKTYQISSFVQQVSTTLKAIKPNLQISAAVFPMKRESRIVMIQQDWETWIDNGWIDTLSPMSYTSDPDRLKGMFEYVQSSPHKHPLIYPGIALHRLDGGQLVMQVEALREKGSLGSTLFAGAHLDKEKVETLATGPYKEHNSLPPHKDVVKSLQTILADYQQKYDTLRNKGSLGSMDPMQAKAIQDALSQLSGALNSIGPVKVLTAIPSEKIVMVQQNLKALENATRIWAEVDTANPLRVQYFEKNVRLLDGLLAYLADRRNMGTTAAAFKPPGKFTTTTGPAAASKPTATPTSASPSTASAEADLDLQPDAEDLPAAAVPN